MTPPSSSPEAATATSNDNAASTNNISKTKTTTTTTPIPHHPFTTTYPPGAFTPAGLPPYPPPNPHTTGFKLNHFMLRIRSPLPSLHFYITLLGMRSVFTMNTGPFTIYYLGYPPSPTTTTTEAESESAANNSTASTASTNNNDENEVDTNATALQTYGQTTCARLQHTLGLLELYHVHGSEDQPPGYYSSGNDPEPHPSPGQPKSPGLGLGFGHLGFTVPDVRSTVEYLRANGVEVVKEVGKGTSTRRAVPISPQEEALGVGVGIDGKGEMVDLRAEYASVFDQIAFVRDPDGYTVELVPQRMDPLKP